MIKKFLKHFSFSRLLNNIKYFIVNDFSQKELEIIFRAKDEAIDDCVYELEEDKKIFKRLNILNDLETIDILEKFPKSFSRFGDGEIAIIKGIDGSFQQYDPILAQKLLHLLQKKKENVYVGLNRSYFHSSFVYSKINHKFYRLYGTQYRRFFLNHCDPNNLYLDACCFGGYFRLKEDTDFEEVYERNKRLFKNKKIAIVGGEGILSKLKHDVFEYSVDKIVIPAPSVNAFSEYDSIIKRIVDNVPKDYIVCLLLGQTATVLAADLADLGYIAWDIGHLPKDYNAYMDKVEKNEKTVESYWKADI